MKEEINKTGSEELVKAAGRRLRRKSLLLMVSSMVLLGAVAAVSIAWYTRVSNTYAVTFDVADYDLAINENVDDEYLLNVYDYSSVTNQYMAPGTVGWIPLEISTYRSDVDVEYQISLESQMPTEIGKHFRFFYLKESDGKIHYGDAVNTVQAIGEYTKVCLDTQNVIIQDTIPKGTDKQTLCIYWQWYLDANEAAKDEAPLVVSASVEGASGGDGYTYSSESGQYTYQSASYGPKSEEDPYYTGWNELDTDIGRYPKKYYDAFIVSVFASGSQVVPEDGTRIRGTNP